MRKLRFVLADPHEQFLKQLVLQSAEGWFGQAEITAFTERKLLEKFLSVPREADLFLIAEEFRTPGMEMNLAGEAFYLSGQSDPADPHVLCRYDGAEELLREVRALCPLSETGTGERRNAAETVLFYSASGGTGKTAAALAAAAELAVLGKRVLYLNAEPLQTCGLYLGDGKTLTGASSPAGLSGASSPAGLTGASSPAGLSGASSPAGLTGAETAAGLICPEAAAGFSSPEILACLTGPGYDPWTLLKPFVCHMEFDFLPPFGAPLAALGCSPELWKRILLSAAASGEYDLVLMDADPRYDREKAELLEAAGRIVFLTEDSAVSRFAAEKLLPFLDRRDPEKFIMVRNKVRSDCSSGLPEEKTFAAEDRNGIRIPYLEEKEQLIPWALARTEGLRKLAFLLLSS